MPSFVSMPVCPFCQTTISENLSLYGGHCQSCLIEIPGEEAVTDPGISPEVTANEGAAPAGSSWLSSAVAAVVVIGAMGGWWVNQRADPEPTRSSEVSGVNPIPLSEHEDAAIEVATDAVPEVVPERPRKVTRYVTSEGQPPALSEPIADASVVPKTGGSGAGAGLGAAPSDVFGTIGAAPRSRTPVSIVLEDSLKIEEMIGRVLNRGAKQLEQCYNQALKINPGVKGAWYVDFTVTKDGKPVAVSVEALEVGHRGIEECIHRKVSQWRFQRIFEPVDVARRYRFEG